MAGPMISKLVAGAASVGSADDAEGPPLPLGRRIELPGRGTTFVREVPGPPGAPTVVLLHGWMASGGLNWFQAFDVLGEDFRVLAPDMRGHGRGLRSQERFRLTDCADDVAALLEELDVEPAIVIGYSMGGPIATLLWQRHPERVAALGLCATGQEFVTGNRQRYTFYSAATATAASLRMSGVISWLPRQVARFIVAPVTPDRRRPGSLVRWSQAEMRRHDPRAVVEAGAAIATFSSKIWAPHIDVPTTVLVTELDTTVEPLAQRRMARAIPNAQVQRFGDGHLACVNPRFGLALHKLCVGLVERLSKQQLVNSSGQSPVANRQTNSTAG